MIVTEILKRKYVQATFTTDRGVMIYRAAKDENGKWPVTPFVHIATTFSVEQRGGSLGTDNREDLTEGRRGFVGHA